MSDEMIPDVPPWRPVPERPLPPDIPRVPPWRPVQPSAPPAPPVPTPERRPLPFLPIPPEHPAAPTDLWAKLLDRRIVMLAGHLDEAAATRAAAEVMLLDADGEDPIQLHIACPDGDLDASVMLAETLDLVQAPVHALAGGLVGGPAVGVYASAGRRLAHRHAAFHLREPRTQMEGNAEQLAGRIAQHRHQLDYLREHLAHACGQSHDTVAADLRAGRLLTAAAALGYGLVHELAGAARPAARPGPPTR
jgi:ATP-dependent Clp protease protease subunit